MEHIFDVAIIGASIAGSSLALELGRAGIQTVLLDKSTFPRRKPCGEGLSGRGLLALKKLGLEKELLNLPHKKLSGFQVWRGGVATNIAPDTTHEKVQLIGIQRSLLDNLLFNAAQAFPSVTTKLGEQIRAVEKRDGIFVISSDKEIIKSRHLVLANGTHSLLSHKLHIPLRRDARDRYGYSTVLEGNFKKTLSAVTVFVESGYEVYCTPVSKNRLTIALLGSAQSVKMLSNKDTYSSLIENVKRHISFEGEIVEAPMGIGPLGTVYRKGHFEGIILVGDACESLDPIAGMGMTHALLSSSLAAKALVDIIQHGAVVSEALVQYERAREAAVRPLRGFTQITQYTLTILSEKIFRLLSHSMFAKTVSALVHQEKPGVGSPLRSRACELMLSAIGFFYLH